MGAITPTLGIPYVTGADGINAYPAADKAQAEALDSLLSGGSKAAWGWAKQNAAQAIPDQGAGVLMSGLTLDGASVGVTLQSGNALRAPTKGIYLMTGTVAWAASAAGGRVLYLNLNGAQILKVIGIASTAGTSIVGTFTCPMNAGDLLTVTLWQSSGAALNTNVPGYACGMTLTRL